MTTNLIGGRETIEENYEVQGEDGTPKYRVRYEKRTSREVLRETAPRTTNTPNRKREYVYVYSTNQLEPGKHKLYATRENDEPGRIVEGSLEEMTDELKGLPRKVRRVIGI